MMATELETLRKRRDETMAQLETLVRDAGLELDVQRLASLTGQRQAAETVLQRLASQIANLERQEAERERAAALEKQRQAVDKATGPALRAFLEFQKRLAELQAVYTSGVACKVEVPALVGLAPTVDGVIERLRAGGVDGLPQPKAARADYPRRPEPPKPKVDTSAHYFTVQGVRPDARGRHGEPDYPPLFSPSTGRPPNR